MLLTERVRSTPDWVSSISLNHKTSPCSLKYPLSVNIMLTKDISLSISFFAQEISLSISFIAKEIALSISFLAKEISLSISPSGFTSFHSVLFTSQVHMYQYIMFHIFLFSWVLSCIFGYFGNSNNQTKPLLSPVPDVNKFLKLLLLTDFHYL